MHGAWSSGLMASCSIFVYLISEPNNPGFEPPRPQCYRRHIKDCCSRKILQRSPPILRALPTSPRVSWRSEGCKTSGCLKSRLLLAGHTGIGHGGYAKDYDGEHLGIFKGSLLSSRLQQERQGTAVGLTVWSRFLSGLRAVVRGPWLCFFSYLFAFFLQVS